MDREYDYSLIKSTKDIVRDEIKKELRRQKLKKEILEYLGKAKSKIKAKIKSKKSQHSETEDFSLNTKLKSLAKKYKRFNKRMKDAEAKRIKDLNTLTRYDNESLDEYKKRMKKRLNYARALGVASGAMSYLAFLNARNNWRNRNNPDKIERRASKTLTGLHGYLALANAKRLHDSYKIAKDAKDRLDYLRRLEYKKQMRV